jgi:hypothetical protein
LFVSASLAISVHIATSKKWHPHCPRRPNVPALEATNCVEDSVARAFVLLDGDGRGRRSIAVGVSSATRMFERFQRVILYKALFCYGEIGNGIVFEIQTL